MKTLRLGQFVLVLFTLLVSAFVSAQEDEPEILPPPPGAEAPRGEAPAAAPAEPLVREEVTFYGVKPLGREVPMHIRALFESHARGEARRQAAFANQQYILNHVAGLNGLPSPFVGPEGQPSLDYVYSGLGRSGFSGDGMVFEPWPYVPGDIWGYPFYDTIESPIGHRITWRGPNAYTYEPVYAGELKHAHEEPFVEDEGPVVEEEAPFEPAAPPVAAVEPAALARVRDLFIQQAFIDAAAALRDAIQTVPREAWLPAAGDEHFVAGDAFARSLRALEAAVAADRRNAGLRLLLAWQYAQLGHADAAAHQCDQALRIDANDREASSVRDWLGGDEE
jgi:hypothetical protein